MRKPLPAGRGSVQVVFRAATAGSGPPNTSPEPAKRQVLSSSSVFLTIDRRMRKREILLIEEDPGSLHDMQPVLASAGHTVRTASGVNEALDILTGFQPGFLVLAPESPSNCGMCLPDLLKLDPRTRNTVVLALA